MKKIFLESTTGEHLVIPVDKITFVMQHPKKNYSVIGLVNAISPTRTNFSTYESIEEILAKIDKASARTGL